MDCLIPKKEKQNSTITNYQSNIIKKAAPKSTESMKDVFPAEKQTHRYRSLIISQNPLPPESKLDCPVDVVEGPEPTHKDSIAYNPLNHAPSCQQLVQIPEESKLHQYLSNKGNLNSDDLGSFVSSQNKQAEPFTPMLAKRDSLSSENRHKPRALALDKEEFTKRINNIRSFWRRSHNYRPIVYVKRQKITFSNTGERCIYDYADHSFLHVTRR